LVHYRWQALFDRRQRIERIDRRRSGQFLHVKDVPGVFMVVPAWMVDARSCAGMALRRPHMWYAALSELDDPLKRRGLRRCSSDETTTEE
jgi:hypothetical protein